MRGPYRSIYIHNRPHPVVLLWLERQLYLLTKVTHLESRVLILMRHTPAAPALTIYGATQSLSPCMMHCSLTTETSMCMQSQVVFCLCLSSFFAPVNFFCAGLPKNALPLFTRWQFKTLPAESRILKNRVLAASEPSATSVLQNT